MNAVSEVRSKRVFLPRHFTRKLFQMLGAS